MDSSHFMIVMSKRLGIEKVKDNLSPIIMDEIFPDINYNGPGIRSQTDFELPHQNSTKKSRHITSSWDPKYGISFLTVYKESLSLIIFQNKIYKIMCRG